MSIDLGKLRKLKNEMALKNIFNIISSNHSNVAALYMEEDEIMRVTYQEFEKQVRVAAYKLANTVGADYIGRFIGLKHDNCPNWPVVFWAILMAGYKPILIDYRLNEQMTGYLLAESNAAAIICNEESNSGLNTQVIYFDNISSGHEGFPEDWEPQWADEIALCTSGTTNTSKIFVYNGYALSMHMMNAEEADRGIPEFITENEARALAFLPFHHVFGLFGVYLWYSFFGKTIVYLKDRSASSILESCRKLKVTHIFAVPLLWNNLAAAIVKKVTQLTRQSMESFDALCDSSIACQRDNLENGLKYVSEKYFKELKRSLLGEDIRLLVCGGGYVLPKTLKVINAIGYQMTCGFGMTEVGITSSEFSENIDARLSGGVGNRFPAYEYKIIPLDDEHKETGELYIRGEAIHTGRLVGGKIAAPELDENGWLASGDIVSQRDGSVYIIGRAKEVIINESGENVYPDEIEERFFNLPNVEQFSILGIKNKNMNEDITLVLYLAKHYNDENIKRELMEELHKINGTLPVYKKVRQALITLSPLPVANGIKVQRQKLKDMIENNCIEYIKLEAVKSSSAGTDKECNNLNESGSVGLGDRIKEEIKEFISFILGIPANEICDDDHFLYDLEGDSLQSIELFTSITKKYNIIIPEHEYYRCSNVSELSELVIKHSSY